MSESGQVGSDEITVLLADYEQSAREWDHAADDARTANSLFVRNHGVYKRLRGNSEGRHGITALLADPIPGVRLMAATHSLEWQESEAVAVLEALAQTGGLHAVTAKYTLRGYHSGSLNLDW